MGGVDGGATPLHDMHCHLGFARNATDLAAAAAADGTALLSCTVDPRAFAGERERLALASNVRVGVGMHPWWIADASLDEHAVDVFCEHAAGARFVGEVGLDFGRRCNGSEQAQLAAFERACRALSGGGKVISLHAVRAAGTCMDVMERCGCIEGNVCIFHWFSGSSPELTRAVGLGFRFSVNAMMLATRRGREYAKAVPAAQLLLETDLPERDAGVVGYGDYRQALARAARGLADIKGEDVLERVAWESACVLGL